MKDFFVSYNSADRAWAEWMAWQLEEAGYTVVIQAWDFGAGGNFVLDMQKAATESERTIAVLSPDYLTSKFTQPEWAAAFAQDATGEKGTLIPIRVRECAPEGLLPQIVYIDLVGLDEAEAKARLLADVQKGRKKPATAPKFPGAKHHTVTKPDTFPGDATTPDKPETPAQPPPQAAPPLELNLTIGRVGEALQTSLALPETGLNAGPFPFAPPIKPDELDELRWYLEDYWKWPVGPDVERAERLERRLKAWGDALFGAVFGQRDALRLWDQFRGVTDRPRLLTLDTTDPDALRLPWELLADEEGHLFALDIPLRRRIRKVQAATQTPFDLPIRILMTVARPMEAAFIDPRASSKAVLDAVAQLGTENVVVEFLHPPTLLALTQRLHARRKPPVHVVHFDGHGVYQAVEGLGYLAFEDGDGKLDLVDAERLGTLLANAKIPLMVLDACQSAHADTADPFISLAPRLVQAGVGSVVAMQYSVLVETARRFFAAFYRALADGDTIGEAMDEGRRDLLADTKRHTLYRPDEGEVALHLRDWFLPALYQQTSDPAPFANAVIRSTNGGRTQDGRTQDGRTQGSPLHGEFPEPQYPFTGRAEELWKLDRLLHDRQIAVLHGFGGQGKTALATETARWLTRARRFDRALFVSFETGGDADWVLGQMGRLLDGDFSQHAQADRLPKLKELLAEAPTLLVWDNFESVLPGWHAELPADALEELLALGIDLTPADGETRLLMTTREADLPHTAYAPSQRTGHLPLGGLRATEALAFAGEVLDTLGVERPPERPALERLLDYLGCHPLSIQLTLPHLSAFNNDVEAIIACFDDLYPGFTAGAAKQRHESLAVSLSFSLSRLNPSVRERLNGLGVFEGGALQINIPPITGLSEAEWNDAARELLRAGLMREERLPGIAFPYYHFHPTLCPHLRSRLSDNSRGELEARYRERYYQVSGYFYHEDNRNPHQTRALVRRELPNLRRALDLTVAAGDVETAVDFAKNVERFLNVLGRWRERAALNAKIDARSTTTDGPLTKTEYLQTSHQGEVLLDAGRAREAEAVFRGLLDRMDAGAAYESGYDHAITLGRLGRSLGAQGRPRDAETEYRRALAVLSGLDPERDDVRRQTGATHTDLADVLRDQGRYGEARSHYEEALKYIQAIGDDRSEAAILGQLGTLALTERNYAEARARYREAIERFRAMGETRTEAIAWHQLAMVAQTEAKGASGGDRGRLLSQAETAYQESLRLKEAIGDQAGVAKTANQLAIVARLANRPADAERWYRRTLENANLLPDLGAGVYNNLAHLLLTVHRTPAGDRPPEFAGRDLLAEAEMWARKALEIKESIGDLSLGPWTTYNILAGIAEARGDGEAAAGWRRKERAAFAAFPGNWARLAPQ